MVDRARASSYARCKTDHKAIVEISAARSR
jgi:hypothetical protein